MRNAISRVDGPAAEGRGTGAAVGAIVCLRLVAIVAVVLCAAPATVDAQPDPRQMSGIPLPDPALPAGTITVRVIRGQLSNNVPDHPVELREGDTVVTASTDGEGRAEFLTLNPGATVVAATELDGVRIESQPFPVPGRGGVRLMLVGAVDPGGADAPAQPGVVTFGADSRIVVELGEESVTVFYILDVVNAGQIPVEPVTPVTMMMPLGAQSTTVLADSDPRTRAEGAQVTLPGPFSPGATPLRVAYVLAYSGDSLAINQALPVDLDALLVIIEKWGAMDVASNHIARRADMNPDGADDATYIFAAGPPIPAGGAVSFDLSGLPHHSRLPSTVALVFAAVMLAAGVWGGAVPIDTTGSTDRRRRLESRRDKRFADLVRLEQQHRAGKVGATKYASRRQDLVAALERIYGELDDEVAPVVLSSTRGVTKTSQVTGQSSTTG